MRIVCIRDDGGRAAAGFMPPGGVDDCVARSISIATQTPYAQGHAALGRIAGDRRQPDFGPDPWVSQSYLEARGWSGILNQLGSPGDEWRATMADPAPGRYVLVHRDFKGDGHFQAFIVGDDGRGEVHDLDSGRGLWKIEEWIPHPIGTGWWPQLLSRESSKVGDQLLFASSHQSVERLLWCVYSKLVRDLAQDIAATLGAVRVDLPRDRRPLAVAGRDHQREHPCIACASGGIGKRLGLRG